MTDTITNESITTLARTLGNKRGWKANMPASPPGLPPGGLWAQQRAGDTVRLRYQPAHGQPWHDIGQWTDNTPAPPAANGIGPKPAPRDPAPVAREDAVQEAIILLTPTAGDAWRLNAYGVDRSHVIQALRLALVHLVARQSGVLIIDEVIAPDMAIVTERLPQPRPARKPTASRVKTTVRYPDDYYD